ncbi:MAG TPA: AI-2E family transporter [Thermoanaerobaculia bacterium]|jgi:predicted PurR-regulated permease PerM
MSNDGDGSARRYERFAVGAALLILAIGCYLIVRPFLTAFIWGSIISLSTRGIYRRILGWVGGRRRLAATLCSLALVLVLLIPIGALAVNLAAQMPDLTARFRQMLDGGLSQPPTWLAGVPLVGKAAAAKWQAFAADPESLRRELRPFLGPVKDFLVTAVAGVGVGLLEFALALLIAGLLYVRGDRFAATVDRIARRLGGETGHRQVVVVRSTVKSVFIGMLGTCAVQAVLALIGFWIAGVPQPFLLAMGTFFLSLVPGGPTVFWLPAALWLNANGSAGWAIFMAVWGLVVVGGADNVVRPLLIGRGVEAPMALIFLGVIGGLLTFGFLGLFIGPTLLVVAHNLFQEWIGREIAQPAPAAKGT